MATFKIGIQTMGNKRHQIDVKESDTVVDVKRKIADELQLGAADEQKLIHMGRILKDDQTLESVKIKANDVLVVMFSKKKATTPAAPAASSSSSSAPAPAPTPTTSSVTTPASTPATTSVTNSSSALPPAPTTSAPTATATAPTSSTTPATAPPGNYQQAASALLTGGAREDMIQNLMGLGFPRNEVELALRAAFNNPDRAADYLFNGIPDGALAAAGVNRSGAPTGAGAGGAGAGAGAGTGATGAAPTGAAATGGATGGASGAARGAGTAGAGAGAGVGAGGAGLGALLGALGGSGGAGGAGGADQVRQLLASNPQLIPMLLQQLSQTNPEVVQQIQENPAAFLQMLGGALGGAGGAGGGAGGGGAGGPRSHVIQVTPEEKQAIDNLENLGFDRHRALEAFLLCDRNYELAANYLFENQAQFAAEDMEAQQNRGAGGGSGGGSGGGDDGEEGDGDDYGDMPE